MTPDEARAMPGAFTAYRRTDGGDIFDEFSWVTDIEFIEDCDETFEVEEIVMVPVQKRTFWIGRHPFVACDDDPNECEQCSGEPGGPGHEIDGDNQ